MGTFRGKKRGKVLSIVAAVLSVLAIVITLAMQSAASKAIDDSIKVQGHRHVTILIIKVRGQIV